MTNYNERLDEIFHDLYLAGWNDKLLDDSPTAVPSENQEKRKAKQAITSLIKELVAEAKPKEHTPTLQETLCSITGEPFIPLKRKKSRPSLDEFEQNLLKALEEV